MLTLKCPLDSQMEVPGWVWVYNSSVLKIGQELRPKLGVSCISTVLNQRPNSEHADKEKKKERETQG